MGPLLDEGYCVTVDNYYNSPELVDKLIARKTDVYGTARPRRKEMPNFDTKRLRKGEIEAFQRGKCLCLQWKDKKPVTFLSTVHSAGSTDVTNRKGEVVSKPIIVIDYNNTMGGVDKSDQNLSDYPSARDGQKIYYKKLFRHLVDMVIYNASALYTKSGNSISHLEFRLSLVEGLIQQNCDNLGPQ